MILMEMYQYLRASVRFFGLRLIL